MLLSFNRCFNYTGYVVRHGSSDIIQKSNFMQHTTMYFLVDLT